MNCLDSYIWSEASRTSDSTVRNTPFSSTYVQYRLLKLNSWESLQGSINKFQICANKLSSLDLFIYWMIDSWSSKHTTSHGKAYCVCVSILHAGYKSDSLSQTNADVKDQYIAHCHYSHPDTVSVQSQYKNLALLSRRLLYLHKRILTRLKPLRRNCAAACVHMLLFTTKLGIFKKTIFLSELMNFECNEHTGEHCSLQIDTAFGVH